MNEREFIETVTTLGHQRTVDLSAVDEQFDVSDIAGARVLYSAEHEEPLSIKHFTESENETLASGDTLTIYIKAKGAFAM